MAWALPDWVEFMRRGVDKGVALRTLAERSQCPSYTQHSTATNITPSHTPHTKLLYLLSQLRPEPQILPPRV